jgi:hypothetical protein
MFLDMNFTSLKMIKGCRYSNNKCNSTSEEITDTECILEDNECYTLEEHSKRNRRKSLENQKQSINPFRTSSRPPPPTPPPPPPRTTNLSRPTPPPPKSSFRPPLPPGPRPQKISGVNKCIYSGLKYISGPISWYYYEWNGRSFHFFGDVHFSFENNCESKGMKCSSVTDKEFCDCFDFIFFLDTIFTNAEKSGKLVDFFIEVPYLTQGQTIEEIEADDYISTIYHYFKNCFQIDKSKCPFKKTRLHYADVRQDISTQNKFTSTLYMNIYLYLEELYNLIVKLFSDYNYDEEITLLKIHTLSEWLNNFFHRFFSRKNGDHLHKRYMASYFSNDFSGDIDRVFDSFMANKEIEMYPDQVKLLQKIIGYMKREAKPYPKRTSGNKIHVIKIQLEELKKDIQNRPEEYQLKDLPELIENFILDESDDYSTQIINIWNDFYQSVILEIYKNPQSKVAMDHFIKKQNLINGDKSILNQFFIRQEAVIMDAYTLSRMFRTYTTSKNPTPIADMTITYTGYYHTKNYSQFFQNVLKIEPIDKYHTDENNINRCIHDDKFSIYFKEYL